MEELFNQLLFAAQNGAYLLALAGALIIPDICGALEAPNGEATGATYRGWFDRWVAPLHGGIMDGDTCWKFRCSLLHQGTTQHPQGQYSRVIFLEPGGTNVFHMNVMNDALNIDVREFSVEMVGRALAWRQAVQGTEPYETNLTKFVTRYPNGLHPYIVGPPVIS